MAKAVAKGAVKRGRPPKDPKSDQPTKDRIVAWISEGKTLREFCRENKIHYTTVYAWREKDDEFAQRFARGRDIGHDVIAEGTLDIIDEPPAIGPDGKVDGGHVQWMKARVEQRLKLLAKWSPKKYGEKVDLELSGKNGGPVEFRNIVINGK